MASTKRVAAAGQSDLRNGKRLWFAPNGSILLIGAVPGRAVDITREQADEILRGDRDGH